MEKLFKVADEEGVLVFENASLPESYLGLYVSEDNHYPSISLSYQIFNNLPLSKEIFCEEIGHHLTTPRHLIPKYFKTYEDRLTHSFYEYRARRKGSQKLIYPEEILDAVSHGIEEIWELAEHFKVREDFMKFRLRVWEISGK